MNQLFPSTDQIHELFIEEITAIGGEVSDTFHNGERLFLRSIFPKALEVRPKDRVQGGVALRAVDDQIVVHPYVFRQVCTNGAIFAQATGSCEIQRVSCQSGEAILSELAFAIRACSQEEAFAENVGQMQMAANASWLNLLPILSNLSGDAAIGFLEQIFKRLRSEERSGFGLMNAVTSVARDTKDPEHRWRLEELGGLIAAMLAPVPEQDDASVALIA